MVQGVFFFLSFLLFLYLVSGTIYLFTIALAGRFGKKRAYGLGPEKRKILVVIPSFKEDAIIVETALKAKLHNYPSEKFSVLVVADKLQDSTLKRLRELAVEVMKVDENMKARSIHRGLENQPDEGYQIAMILDADNIMQPGCLEKINGAFAAGHLAVQCYRKAKNQQTPVALLDAISEEINVNLFRRGPCNLGLSAAPIGSGMAFEFKLAKEIYSVDQILNNPGEDREVDVQLMKRGIPMEFLNDAYVLDEKVSSVHVFEKQRIRWLEAQFSHLRRLFDKEFVQAKKTRLYYNKVFQNLLLPRVLFLLIFALVFILLLVEWNWQVRLLYPRPAYWLVCMLLFSLALGVSIPWSFYSWRTLQALLHIPQLMFSMVRALLKTKKGRREFLHTPKTFSQD